MGRDRAYYPVSLPEKNFSTNDKKFYKKLSQCYIRSSFP